jgi:hypothetical protein
MAKKYLVRELHFWLLFRKPFARCPLRITTFEERRVRVGVAVNA